MFGNPDGGDHLDMVAVHRSAAFGYSLSDRGSKVDGLSERSSEVKRKISSGQVIEEQYTPATEEDLQFIDEMIQQTSA